MPLPPDLAEPGHRLGLPRPEREWWSMARRKRGRVVKNPRTGLWVAIKYVGGRPPMRIIGCFKTKRAAQRALRRRKR